MTPLDPGAIDGASARQMRAAPQGATFVIHNGRATGYFMALAAALGRTDLIISPLSRFDALNAWRGRKHPPFVVDHYAATVVNDGQRRTLRELGAKI